MSEFKTPREFEIKSKMAEKFIANLSFKEIKAFLKMNHDPRYTSVEGIRETMKDLTFSLDNGMHNEYIT